MSGIEETRMRTNDRLTELVNDIKNGNEEAFSGLYEESYKYLHTCVIHIVKDEETAQDMLQDTYVEIFKNISQLKEAEGFLGWAATIANRKCFAYLKKKKDILVDEQTDDEGNESDYFENIADDEAFIPENIFDNQEKINIIRGIIDDLSDVQRACVIGFYYNEQKQDEIADELGIPVNTVKSHLNRAKAKIKEAVGDVEKKQGIKLLSVVPFMFALFGYETKAYAAELAVPGVGASLAGAAISNVGAGASGSATANATGTVAAKVGTGTTKTGVGVTTKAGTAAKTTGMALKTKLAIGATAGVVGIGAVTGIVNQNSNKNPFENTYIDFVEIENQVRIFGEPLSLISRNEAEQYMMDLADSMQVDHTFNQEDVTSVCYKGDNGLALDFTNWMDREDANYIDYDVRQYNADGYGAGKLSFSVARFFAEEDKGNDQFSITRAGAASLDWYVYYDDAGNQEKEESISISMYESDSLWELFEVEPVECPFLGQSLEEYLNTFDSGLYEQALKNERVDFQNGSLSYSDNSCWFHFNDVNPEESEFSTFSLSLNENGLIEYVYFHGRNAEELIDPNI